MTSGASPSSVIDVELIYDKVRFGMRGVHKATYKGSHLEFDVERSRVAAGRAPIPRALI